MGEGGGRKCILSFGWLGTFEASRAGVCCGSDLVALLSSFKPSIECRRIELIGDGSPQAPGIWKAPSKGASHGT